MLEPHFNSAAGLQGGGGGGGLFKSTTLLKRYSNTGAFLLSMPNFKDHHIFSGP